MASRFRQRGAHIEQLEREIHALRRSKEKKKASAEPNRARVRKAKAAHPAVVKAFVQSTAYNKSFAGGHQASGIVPCPAQSPDKQPRSYMACSGTVSMVVATQPGGFLWIVINPYNRNPIAIRSGVNMALPAYPTSTSDYTSDFAAYPNTSSGGHAVLESAWVGLEDPRFLVSGYRGNYQNEVVPIVSGFQIEQQFMGGSFEMTSTASFDTSGTVTVFDSKSYPTLYGSKLTPTTTVGQNYLANEAAYINIPDAEDTFQHFVPVDFADYTIADLVGMSQNLSLTGGGSNSTCHTSFNITPDGTRWAPWNGAFAFSSAGPPVEAWNNASIGGMPARNFMAMLNGGYPFLIVRNTGTSPVNITIRAKFYYNVHIPTTGPLAVPVLAVTAPVTKPHAADVASIHSTPILHTASMDHAKHETLRASICSSQKAGADDAHLYIKTPDPVHVEVSKQCPSALNADTTLTQLPDLLGGALGDVDPSKILDAVKNFDPSEIIGGATSLAETAGSIFGSLGALF